MKIRTTLLALCASFALGNSAVAGEGNMGDHHWVCQVTTPSTVFGFVTVWADTREIARDIASRAKAYTVNETVEPTQNIIECVQLGKETLRDENFWKFYLQTPR